MEKKKDSSMPPILSFYYAIQASLSPVDILHAIVTLNLWVKSRSKNVEITSDKTLIFCIGFKWIKKSGGSMKNL